LDVRKLSKAQWAEYRMGLRRSISGTLQRLNADEAVTELELAQLHNFVMFSLDRKSVV
jgi:hypothetical protein